MGSFTRIHWEDGHVAGRVLLVIGARLDTIALMRTLRCLVSVTVIALTARAQTAANPRDSWNKIFGDPKVSFNRAPSRLLTVAIADSKPGAAIDLGMGEGRNAIFLAQRGWRVTGVDLSDVAVAQAKKRAAELGVPLEAVVEDLDKYDFGHERWDLITLFYMHAWYHLSKLASAHRLRDALKPGGMLVIEGFAGGQVGYQTNELVRAFNDLNILRYEDVRDEADWAPGEKSRIVRFVAEKPR